MTPIQLVAHVYGDLVQGDMSRSLVHDLDVLFPGTKSEFTVSLELGKLSFVVGIIASRDPIWLSRTSLVIFCTLICLFFDHVGNNYYMLYVKLLPTVVII